MLAMSILSFLTVCRRSLKVAHRRALLFSFDLLYGFGARVYDGLTALLFAGEWRRWQLTAVPNLPPAGVIVELGCGTGALASTSSPSFRLWLGIDRSPAMVKRSARRRRDGLVFLRASADRLPLRDGFADGVVATFPSDYILQPLVVAEIRRVLCPGGICVVVLAGDLSPTDRRRRVLNWASRLGPGEGDGVAARFALRGFAGSCRWESTQFGRALVYVGRPIVTLAGDCNPPTGDADELG
jgi:SAM-dependent methyltransferase